MAMNSGRLCRKGDLPVEFLFWMVVGAGLVWGGIAWLKPSPKELGQMKAREKAMQVGLSVKILPCGAFAHTRFGQTTLPFYSIDLSVPHFRLWQSGDQWVAEDEDAPSNQLTPKLERWLALAPEAVVGIESRGQRIGAWWAREKVEGVEAVKRWLADCPLEARA